jgi:hypothetical protein
VEVPPQGAAIELSGQPGIWAAIKLLSSMDPVDISLVASNAKCVIIVSIIISCLMGGFEGKKILKNFLDVISSDDLNIEFSTASLITSTSLNFKFVYKRRQHLNFHGQ